VKHGDGTRRGILLLISQPVSWCYLVTVLSTQRPRCTALDYYIGPSRQRFSPYCPTSSSTSTTSTTHQPPTHLPNNDNKRDTEASVIQANPTPPEPNLPNQAMSDSEPESVYFPPKLPVVFPRTEWSDSEWWRLDTKWHKMAFAAHRISGWWLEAMCSNDRRCEPNPWQFKLAVFDRVHQM
jgi:hypothetical protein